MSEKEKNESTVAEAVAAREPAVDDVQKITSIQLRLDELKELLEKEKQKSLRLLADYQNLEKQTVARINARGDKIILDFLTVYEDFIRSKNAYEKE